MAEPLSTNAETIPDDGPPPAANDFPGCRAVRIPLREIEDFDGRLEYWDARNETAYVAEAASPHHEYRAQRFASCIQLIALRRGSPIDVIGASDIVVRGKEGGRERVLEPDQVAYLHPGETRPRGKEILRGVDHLPDVVLEVDHSTDARRRKLGLYESWGFPEVWVEVPDEPWHYRPKSRRSGLTIHVLEGGRYVEAPSSRAFPGWTAQEIHAALNEWEASLETVDVLRRVADELAAAEGTGPDNDPFLRRERAEGRAQGHAEGRAEAQCDIVRTAVHQAFAARGLVVTATLRSWLDDLADAPDAPALIREAWECSDADDFLRRARGPA